MYKFIAPVSVSKRIKSFALKNAQIVPNSYYGKDLLKK